MGKETPDKLKVVIVANGHVEPNDAERVLDADLVIAADGGAAHCDCFGRLPDLVVGDLDSIDPALAEKISQAGAAIIRHPRRKDQTDLELALGEAAARGAGDIVILGGLGGRWDMTLATVLGLAAPNLAGIRTRLVDGNTEMVRLTGPERHTVHGRPGDTLSLLPLGGDAVGVTLKGLEYPLLNATVRTATALGVSNVLTDDCAEIVLEKGLLLCVHISGG